MPTLNLLPPAKIIAKNKLFQEYRNMITYTQMRNCRMGAFTLSNEANQASYLNELQARFFNGIKLPAPEYFVTNWANRSLPLYKEDYLEKHSRLFNEGLYNPHIYPIVSFYSQEYTTQIVHATHDDQRIRMQMHLLKPSLLHSSGNSAFISQDEFETMDETLFSPSSLSKHEHALFMPFEKELLYLFGNRLEDMLSIDPTFHWSCDHRKSEKRILHISEIRDTLDYHLFKKHWPIFDWEGAGRHPFHKVLSPKILL